jgi:NAD(P)-dependent dehydrogenase (short-subunit alcohol dehydrogenase family)
LGFFLHFSSLTTTILFRLWPLSVQLASGIGFETSLLLARNGFRTYATVKELDKAKAIKETFDKHELPITVVELDVISDKSVSDAIDKITNKEGKTIDLLVNNASYGQGGALEDDSMDEIKALFGTNLFGAVRVMRAVLPILRKQHSGIIVNITSMGGKMGFPYGAAYHGSKFALEGTSESMRYETEPFGIKLIVIEPGLIRTNFSKNHKIGQKAADSSSSYSYMLQAMQKAFKRYSGQEST